jgi:hypothetical protein
LNIIIRKTMNFYPNMVLIFDYFKMSFRSIIALMILSACIQKKDAPKKALPLSQKASAKIMEYFVDSTHIGQKGQCKIELIKQSTNKKDSIFVKFHLKNAQKWHLENSYAYKTNALTGFQPEISDYNNDQYNDINFVSASAARLSNQVRRLFIYDAKKQNLRPIVNAEDYPNMTYNKRLNCVDAFLFHGGSSTVFARIKGDSLLNFAAVHNDSHRMVYEINAKGKEILLRKDRINENEVYTRYIDYKPLKKHP